MDDDDGVPASASPSPASSPVTDPVTVAAEPPGGAFALKLPIQRTAASLYPTSSGGGGGREDAWSEGATSALIDAWGERFVALGRGSLRHPQWQEVADAVSSRDGYSKASKSDVQCKNRVDTLKKRYKVERAKPVSSWQFFDRLDELLAPIYGQKPADGIGGGHIPNGRDPMPAALRAGFPQRSRTAAVKRREPSPEPSASVESSDGFPPPALPVANGKRRRTEEDRGDGGSDRDRVQGLRELSVAIRRLGEAYERVETAKLEQAVETERRRMEFARELESERVQIFLNTQMELTQSKNRSSPAAVTIPSSAITVGAGSRRMSVAADAGGSSNHHSRYRISHGDRHRHAPRHHYRYHDNHHAASVAANEGEQTGEEDDDEEEEVLRVLDYSRNSRHLLVTAGDDGSVHLWDTTAKSPKVSWLKQHSAPTSGVCISPSSDKIIATVGLDKKLYTLDTGSKRSTHTIPHEAPFSSLAYNDDGTILAAGTNSGRVVFYDVRGKPQPLTILRAYNSSEAVTGLCWQRSKPIIVNENSSSEIALLGGSSEESVLMPDPLPSATSFPSGAVTPSLRSSLTSGSSTLEETPYRTRPLSGGPLTKLQAPRGNYNLKDDMDVFSPLVDVQPFTPSSGNWWDEQGSDDTKKYDKPGEKKLSATKKFPYTDDNNEWHPISDWRSIANSRQDGTSSVTTTSVPSWKSEPSISSPETSTGTALPDRLIQRQQISRFGASAFPTGSLALQGLQDSASTASQSLKGSVTSNILMNLQNKGILSNAQSSLATSSASLQSSLTPLYATKAMSLGNSELPGAAQSTSMWRPSTYTDRLSSSSVFSEGLASAFGSPKSKKTGVETKDELLSTLMSRQEAATTSSTNLLSSNGVVPPQLPMAGSTDQQVASSFSLQYVQRMLDESLGSVQKSIHEDVRNLHIELLRQFHMQEMEMSGVLNLVLEKLEGLTKEVQQLRRENQQLRHQLL